MTCELWRLSLLLLHNKRSCQNAGTTSLTVHYYNKHTWPQCSEEHLCGCISDSYRLIRCLSMQGVELGGILCSFASCAAATPSQWNYRSGEEQRLETVSDETQSPTLQRPQDQTLGLALKLRHWHWHNDLREPNPTPYQIHFQHKVCCHLVTSIFWFLTGSPSICMGGLQGCVFPP